MWNISHSKKNWERYDHKCLMIFVWSTRYSFPILTELELSLWLFERYWNMKFYENASCESRVFPCGRTDMTKLIVAFCNFEKAPKKFQLLFFFIFSQFVTNDAAKLRITNPYIPVVAAVLPQWNILSCDGEMQKCSWRSRYYSTLYRNYFWSRYTVWELG